MRVQKEARDIEIGDAVFFPNSRHTSKVGQVLIQDGHVKVISDDRRAQWTMTPETIISVEVEEDSDE